MTELQLLSICSASERQQLVTQTNSEDRILTKQLGDHFNSVGNILRVPRAVGQLNSVWAQTADFISRCVVRHNYNVTISFIQFTQDTALCAKVD
ncbi:hypothetical protein D3C78_1169640 [compost metagenome]